MVFGSSFDGMGFDTSGSNRQSQQADSAEQVCRHHSDAGTDGKAKLLFKGQVELDRALETQ